MGNTLTTPAQADHTTVRSHQAPPRSSNTGLRTTGQSLRKIESTSTLSNFVRVYHHSNHSSMSMTSRASKNSKTSSRRTHEKALDISKPTQVEHGIHVEYNKDNGTFMGLPDVWQSTLPSDDVLNTTYINPNLVPSPATARAKIIPMVGKKAPAIGKPFNVQHNVHVQVDDKDGYKGLPTEWQKILQASGVPEDIIRANPKAVERLMHVRMPDSLQRKQKEPDSPHSAGMIHNGLDTGQHHPLSPSSIADLPVGFAPPSRSRNSRLINMPSLQHSTSSLALTDDTKDESRVVVQASLPRSESQFSLDSNFIDDIADTTDPTLLYTDLILIAEGESGPMFAAKHIASGRVVAIKKISRSADQKLSKIRNELTTMKMSRHPNVVEYIACYNTEEEVWVVTECMDVSLADILSVTPDGPMMREDQMARVARDILRALSRLHSLHRIHRDIRSDNVLLNTRGDVKLADFGHCAQLSKAHPSRNSVVGTPYWMAPEVIKAHDYDGKADIWSLGVLMLEMTQGDPPYVEHPPLRALFLIASNGLPPLREPERWSDELKSFFEKCTAIDPAERPTAIQLLKHPFVRTVGTTEDMMELIEETRKLEMMQQEEEEKQAEADLEGL